MRQASGAIAWFPLVLCGCAVLPEIPVGACGNGVIESPEDCDTFAPDAKSVCRPRGTAGECHLDCRRRSDGTRPSCPTGWGCDFDSICRAPTGNFGTPSTYKVGGATSLMAGDFDGDGRADILSREPLDAFGRSKLRFHYFDEKGVLSASRLFPKFLSSPVITDLSDDGRSDIVFSDTRVGLLLGQADRNWVPETFGSFHVPSPIVRMVAVYDGPIEDDSGLLAASTLNGIPGFYYPDATGVLRLRGTLSQGLEALVGEIACGNLVEDPATSPCREVVSAVRNATTFSVLDVCTRDAASRAIRWRNAAEPSSVSLEPPAPIDVAPLIADVNGDGHLDVLVGAGGKTYASFGDGLGLSVATPYQLAIFVPTADSGAPMADSDAPLVDVPMPLAAGDFTGDGAADFVFGDHLLVSIAASGQTSPIYVRSYGNMAAAWTDAKIADMNGNGKIDVVVASRGRPGIDFYNGTGTQHLTAFNVPTDRPVEHLAVGDFDGDLINDLAFVESAASSIERDAIMISFGVPAGPPIAPKVVARVARTEQLTVYTDALQGNLVISSTETVGGMSQGVFTLLDGSGDRIPYAPYQLASFLSDGSLYGAGALGIAVGGFIAPHSGDVLAVATTDEKIRRRDWQLWIIPALGRSSAAAAPLDYKLDPTWSPAQGDETGRRLNLVSASADVDGDGRDEALWAMPAGTDQQCGIAIVSMGEGGKTAIPRGTIVLDETCLGAQLLPVDADGDGRIDIAILTGAPAAMGRKLLVMWNDGKGNFSSSDVTNVARAGDSPEGFTVLPAIPSRPFSFAYVTNSAAMLVSTTATPRRFGSPTEVIPLVNGSGIVAADVNGDDAVDLVLAASGDLLLLKAELKIP